MNHKNFAVATAITSVLAFGTLAAPAAYAAEKEKCYGVSKAGKNDCATKSSSCAGTAKQDGQADAFVVMPKGLCDKLVGGSTSAS